MIYYQTDKKILSVATKVSLKIRIRNQFSTRIRTMRSLYMFTICCLHACHLIATKHCTSTCSFLQTEYE